MLKVVLESDWAQPGSEHLPEIVAMYGAEVLIREMKHPTPELVDQIRALQASLDARSAMDSVTNARQR